MRFSTLALLVALPAAAYATFLPRQLSVRKDETCVELGQTCNFWDVCCGEDNFCPMFDEPFTTVCSSVTSLPPTDWYVRCASPNPLLESGSLG